LTKRRPSAWSGTPSGLASRGAQTSGLTGVPSDSARTPLSTTGPPSKHPPPPPSLSSPSLSPGRLQEAAKISWSAEALPMAEPPAQAALHPPEPAAAAAGS